MALAGSSALAGRNGSIRQSIPSASGAKYFDSQSIVSPAPIRTEPSHALVHNIVTTRLLPPNLQKFDKTHQKCRNGDVPGIQALVDVLGYVTGYSDVPTLYLLFRLGMYLLLLRFRVTTNRSMMD